MKLIYKKKPIDTDCPDWIIQTKNLHNDEDGRIVFSAKVVYKKSNINSYWFDVKYNLSGYIDVSSNGYGFDLGIKNNLITPKKIVIEALKIPILAGVMYQQGVSKDTAYEHMNKLLGNKIWKK